MHLNLARKWRSQSFEYIVGQELAVRIFKNSLFLGKFFPVYLLAGQHGCGKTTTARVFAAAVNCALLPDFQLDHKNLVPCGTCASCCAMKTGNHPDFIEIDAASHTGVDNVRQLLETATLMPLMGRKKIYLIDEAHMLSKAAFNAFLKMLEEPNDSVLFMLATTDEHKIIDTVKSRCFQLLFQAVAPDVLKNHLRTVCQHEQIPCDDPGLDLIVKQSQGSVRDALNTLEQVFLSENQATKPAVLQVLGAAADEIVLELFDGLVRSASIAEFMHVIEKLSLERYNAEYLWRQLLEVLHAALWLHYGCQKDAYASYAHMLEKTVPMAHGQQLAQLFSWWCQEEAVFLRTINKSIFLQFFLVRAWMQIHAVSSAQPVSKKGEIQEPKPSATQEVQVRELSQRTPEVSEESSTWGAFVRALEQVQEPLVLSIFKQGRIIAQENKKVTVAFAQRLVFLKDTLEQTKTRWFPLFEQQFGLGVQMEYQFVATEGISSPQKKVDGPVSVSRPLATNMPTRVAGHVRDGARVIDVSDKNNWPLANTLLEYFPGTVTSVVETVKPETKKQVVHEEHSQE